MARPTDVSVPPRRFHDEPLVLILRHLKSTLDGAGAVRIEVPDPDLGRGCYPG
ncbi:SAM-dependent methyltransferase, partial [Myxococcus sp. CA039A]|nr:SAM-dependent methyltransferase [Myxococcus sp. CA039A]